MILIRVKGGGGGWFEKQRLEGLPFVSCTNEKIALICVFKYETHIAAADCS